MTATKEFMMQLVAEVPVLAHMYREHEADYDEFLPHVLMGDIARFALQHAGESWAVPAKNQNSLKSLLDVLDKGMRSPTPLVRELIAVSFLENLDECDPHFRSLVDRLGPALATEMARLHGGDVW